MVLWRECINMFLVLMATSAVVNDAVGNGRMMRAENNAAPALQPRGDSGLAVVRDHKDTHNHTHTIVTWSLIAKLTRTLQSQKQSDPQNCSQFVAGNGQHNVLVLMVSTMSISPYACMAAEINAAYSRLHGYDFMHEIVSVNQDNEENYMNKVIHLRANLARAQTVMYVDSDAVFVNFAKPVTDILSRYPHSDLITSGHKYGFDPWTGNKTRYISKDGRDAGLNTGVLIAKNSSWSSEFLAAWVNQFHQFGEKLTIHDQGVFQKMFDDDYMDAQKNIGLVNPPEDLQRGNDDGKDVCHFIAHLWGSDAPARESAFRAILGGQRPKEIGCEVPEFDVRLNDIKRD